MLVFFYCDHPTTTMRRRRGLPCPPLPPDACCILLEFFYCNPITTMRRRRASPMLVLCLCLYFVCETGSLPQWWRWHSRCERLAAKLHILLMWSLGPGDNGLGWVGEGEGDEGVISSPTNMWQWGGGDSIPYSHKFEMLVSHLFLSVQGGDCIKCLKRATRVFPDCYHCPCCFSIGSGWFWNNQPHAYNRSGCIPPSLRRYEGRQRHFNKPFAKAWLGSKAFRFWMVLEQSTTRVQRVQLYSSIALALRRLL